MASSITPIIDGFSYQAFWFWLQACELLRRAPDVKKVGFEVDEYTAFDDVAVEYPHPVLDGVGGTTSGRFYSIKYSVDYKKEMSAASLADPKLINADSISLLERLRDAVRKMEATNSKHLFVLAAPWGLASGDPIRKLVELQTGRIRLESLFDGTSVRGVMGNLRHVWTKRLGLSDQEELRPILARLRLDLRSQTVEDHRNELSVRLSNVGLLPIQKSEPVVQYFPLAYEMRRGGKKWFTADDIRAECQRQKLIQADDKPTRSALRLGFRSFMPNASGLGDEVDHLMCVVDEFSERVAKDEKTWSGAVPERLKAFLEKTLKANGQYDLHLHCFGSIAFLAGYLCEPGMGISTGVVQRQYGRPPEIWTVDLEAVKRELPGFQFSVETIGDGSEFAVAVALAHEIKDAVVKHCQKSLPNVGRVLVARAMGAASFTTIKSGTHAFAVAEQLKNEIARTCCGRKSPLHLFWAAPNAFAYYLGQVSRQLGICQLYEFDSSVQEYSASLTVSPKMRLECEN